MTKSKILYTAYYKKSKKQPKWLGEYESINELKSILLLRTIDFNFDVKRLTIRKIKRTEISESEDINDINISNDDITCVIRKRKLMDFINSEIAYYSFFDINNINDNVILNLKYISLSRTTEKTCSFYYADEKDEEIPIKINFIQDEENMILELLKDTTVKVIDIETILKFDILKN